MRAALHQESENIFPAEVTGYLVRRAIPAQGGDVVGAKAAGIAFGKILFRNLHAKAFAIGLNVVVGFTGLLDLGYVAFYALGAYMAAYWTGALPVQPPVWPIGSRDSHRPLAGS